MIGEVVNLMIQLLLPILAIVAAAMLGGFVAGWTGWGGWIVAGAVVWLFVPPLVALVAAQPVIFAMDLLLARNGIVRWDRIRAILLWALPAVVIGALTATLLPEQGLLLLAGGVLLLAALPGVWQRLRIRAPWAGLLGGFWTTAGGWNAPPLALALADLSPDERRGTLGALFALLAAAALPALLLAGLDRDTLGRGLVLGAIIVPFALAGIWAGLSTSRSASEGAILRICQGLALLGAAALLLRAL